MDTSPKNLFSRPLKDSTSIYSSKSCLQMASEIQHRRRSKTPVFFVGQLERTPAYAAQILSEAFQAVLPLHLQTSLDDACRANHQKRLRKIKRQTSLRALVKRHSQCSARSSDGDCSTETHLDLARLPDGDSDVEQILLPPPSDRADHIGLKICTELLTTELLRQQPDRASGLQILLMIEAYETVQRHLRKMLYDFHVTGKHVGHVKVAEGILDHWLQAPDVVYDRSQAEECRRSLLSGEAARMDGPLFGDG
ncbi:hypothetical protein BUE80_DR001479 [Diplocarpon rosae]|nr:hypothetical protein BUE80_DR001479 [Diplocarpon rosae]